MEYFTLSTTPESVPSCKVWQHSIHSTATNFTAMTVVCHVELHIAIHFFKSIIFGQVSYVMLFDVYIIYSYHLGQKGYH